MHEPFDWRNQPEASGPLTEPRYDPGDGRPALDIQALRQHSVRLPQLDPGALADGEYVALRGPNPYGLDPEQRERERREATLAYDAGREAMRATFENAARHAGADPRVARRTADELMRQVPETGQRGLDDSPALPESAPAAEAAEPVTEPAAEPEVRAAEPDPPVTTAAEPAAVRPRSSKQEKS